MSQPRFYPQYSLVAATVGTDTVIKSAGGGVLGKVIVTVTGANPMQFYDNGTAGSGALIASLPASPALGTVFAFDIPVLNGITIKGSATNPGVTVLWS